MTRTELEREVLELPEAERTALVGAVIKSLGAGERQALRQELGISRHEILEGLGEELRRTMEGWFAGEAEPLTEALCTEILEAGDDHPVRTSLAVPPGWKPIKPI